MLRALPLVAILALAACAQTAEQSTPRATAQPTPVPTPERTVYFVQNGSDSYAGDYLDMPTTAVDVEYQIYGSCAFGVKLFAEPTEADNVDSPSLVIEGPEQKGTWRLNIKLGERYAVGIGADGCSWLVTVRDAS